MKQQEAEQKANELVEMLRPKYSDLVAHVDIVDGTDDIVISFFWNRISAEQWNDAKRFRCKDIDYQTVVDTKIIPFFK